MNQEWSIFAFPEGMQRYNKMSFKAIWTNNSPYSKFLISVGIILISAVFFTIIGTVLATAIFGITTSDIQSMQNDLQNPQSISVYKLIQLVTAIGTFVIPPFVLAWLFDGQPSSYLSLRKSPGKISALAVIVLMAGALPCINFLGELNTRMQLPSFMHGLETWMKQSEENAARITGMFMNMKNTADLLSTLLIIALIPAVGEELLFRGVIQKIFTGWLKNNHTAVWLTAFLFSAMHMQFYGFIPRMLMGAMLGYLLVWSGSLWLPVIAHFSNNALAVLFTYFYKPGTGNFNADTIGIGEGQTLLLISSAFLTVVLLWYVWHTASKTRLLPSE